MLAATKSKKLKLQMPRARPVESHVRCYLSFEREPPRHKAVASNLMAKEVVLATT